MRINRGLGPPGAWTSVGPSVAAMLFLGLGEETICKSQFKSEKHRMKTDGYGLKKGGVADLGYGFLHFLSPAPPHPSLPTVPRPSIRPSRGLVLQMHVCRIGDLMTAFI